MKLEKLQKIITIIKQNLIFYLGGILLIVGIKYFYRGAGSDKLRWLLAPTTRLVTLLCGIPFVYEQDAGYVNHSLRFLIAPSCCGMQFMLITMTMLIFSFIHRIKEESNISKKLGWMLASIGFSYVFTILVNAVRIVLAVYIPAFLENTKLQSFCGTPEQLHTAIGVCVYFTSLLIVYHIAESIFSKGSQKFLSPVFWYFFIVLGIPFLNRAYRQENGKFGQYALLVTSVCAAVLFAAALLRRAYRFITRRLNP
ncbi:MAG: exosortase K [Lachnoclostridium sp.]|nr:exosortase K [Lachnospira sp.]MCM1249410.1 exosortase K [Lachnoclostridium sp.]